MQGRVVHLRPRGHRRDALPPPGPAALAGVGADDVVEAGERDRGGGGPVLGVEGAQRLQPLVEFRGQLGLLLGGLHREDPVLVHHVVDRRPGRLPDQQLVEHEPGGVEVRRHARPRRVPVALRRLVHRVELVDDVFGDGARPLPAGARVIEAAEQRPARSPDDHRVRGQVPMHHLGLAPVRVVEGREHVAGDRDLLVEGQRQRALPDVLPQRVSGHVPGDQDEAVLGLRGEELPHGEDVRVSGQRRHRPERVLDAAALAPALRFRAVGVHRVDANPGRPAALRAEEGVPGAVLRVPVGSAELLLDLPVAVAGRRVPRPGLTDDRLPHLAEVGADVGGPAVRDPGSRLEEGGAFAEVGDRRPVLAARVLRQRIGGGHQHRGVDVQAAERPVGRIPVADQRLERLRVLAQERQRRVVGRAPFRVPLAAVDVDEAARALHVDHVDAVRPEEGDVDLVDLVALPELEVVDDGEGVRQVVAEAGDGLPLGVVDRLADGDHLGHQAVPWASIQCSTRARASRSRPIASCRAVRTANARRPSRRIRRSSSRGSTTPLIPA